MRFAMPLTALFLLGIGSARPAEATIITFDALASPTTTQMPTYAEAGFVFTSSVANSTAFASWGSLDTNYTGSAALFNNYGNGVTTLASAVSAPFGLTFIDLSEVYNASYSPTSVTFVANKVGGGTTTQTFNLDLVFGNQTFFFDSSFGNITSVAWAQTPDYHQFDNIGINESVAAVPEPTSLLLFGTGAAALAAKARRRKKQQGQ